MARQHGADVRIYFGGRDVSGDLSEITPEYSAGAHEATTFASNNWKESDGGLLSWSAALAGFYDPASGGYGRQIEDLLGATGGILSIYDGDADAIGDTGTLFSDAVVTKRSQPINVAELIKLTASLVPAAAGRVGFAGRLLHVKAERTGDGSGSSHNNSAASSNGGRANVHVTAIGSGTWTITVEQSSDNGAGDPWAAIATFSGITAIGGQTATITGSIEQYTRVTFTRTAGTGNITFVCGLARY